LREPQILPLRCASSGANRRRLREHAIISTQGDATS
jgi:hypothetical protein